MIELILIRRMFACIAELNHANGRRQGSQPVPIRVRCTAKSVFSGGNIAKN
jgi:hypothetical protein